jgi:NTE family protein
MMTLSIDVPPSHEHTTNMTLSEPTAHAREEYLPKPKHERQGIALCLSGGGFRAALFHLGALCRLNELGILSQLDMISSVSGGSIVAAHLATRIDPWPAPGTVHRQWEENVAAPFRSFTSTNIRTPAILKRLLPWNWLRSSTGVRALAASYENRLAHRAQRPLRLAELPTRPLFILCATDMAFGVNWIFTRERVGDYQAGYVTTPQKWTMGLAVAASSCFPPVFNPLPIDLGSNQLKDGKARNESNYEECISGLRLTDGGNYDNMGLEPVWKSAQYVLVSDGGSTFDAEPDRNLIWRLSRYTDILGNQVSALRRRWLISNLTENVLEGTYWGIGSKVTSYGQDAAKGYPNKLVDEVISEVRTDLDAFSAAEAAVLENHGYLLAEAAINRHVPGLISHSPEPFSVPHTEWMKEDAVRRELRRSHKRVFPFGRW